MEELTITKEAVLRAAEKCSTAKDILKEIFPEVFADPTHDLGKVFEVALAELLNGAKCLPSVYNYIPGSYSREKAKTICKLITNTYIK